MSSDKLVIIELFLRKSGSGSNFDTISTHISLFVRAKGKDSQLFVVFNGVS